jgi:hypothetical protein
MSKEELQLAGDLAVPIIAQDGDEKLGRPVRSLCWAGAHIPCIIPTLPGNIVGSSLIFTLLVYAQISPEL